MNAALRLLCNGIPIAFNRKAGICSTLGISIRAQGACSGSNFLSELEILKEEKRQLEEVNHTLSKELIAVRGASAVRAPTPLTLSLQFKQRIPKQTIFKPGDETYKLFFGLASPSIVGMSYNSARDELFLADSHNDAVRAMPLRGQPGAAREVYRANDKRKIESLCHLSHSDTLLVSFHAPNNCLVALSRSGREWREAHCVQNINCVQNMNLIICELSDSRVLLGNSCSTYMELFRVQSGARIEHIHKFDISCEERYRWLSATCGNDTLVAASYTNDMVKVHRLRDDRLETLAQFQVRHPYLMMWFADCLLVSNGTLYDLDVSNRITVIELEKNTQRERRRQVNSPKELTIPFRWCAVDDGLVIVDENSYDIVHYNIL